MTFCGAKRPQAAANSSNHSFIAKGFCLFQEAVEEQHLGSEYAAGFVERSVLLGEA
jgi:hypothetical protein